MWSTHSRVLRGVLLFCILQALVVLQVALAYADSFLSISAMQRAGYRQGLPLLWHLGIWGDFLVISPLISIVVANYLPSWSRRSILICLILSITVSCLLAWFYTIGETPGPHVHNHQTTGTGYVHLLYMIIAIATIALLYLFTPTVPQCFIVGITVLLIVHVFFGTHLALGLIKYIVGIPWYPHDPLSDPTAWMTVVTVAVILGFRTLFLLGTLKWRGRDE